MSPNFVKTKTWQNPFFYFMFFNFFTANLTERNLQENIYTCFIKNETHLCILVNIISKILLVRICWIIYTKIYYYVLKEILLSRNNTILNYFSNKFTVKMKPKEICTNFLHLSIIYCCLVEMKPNNVF
jgi:hypothetical protein